MPARARPEILSGINQGWQIMINIMARARQRLSRWILPWPSVKHPAASRGAAYSAGARLLAAKAGYLRNPAKPRTPLLPVASHRASLGRPESSPWPALGHRRAGWRRRVKNVNPELRWKTPSWSRHSRMPSIFPSNGTKQSKLI